MSTRRSHKDVIRATLERAAVIADMSVIQEEEVVKLLPDNDPRRVIYKSYAIMARVLALKIRALKE